MLALWKADTEGTHWPQHLIASIVQSDKGLNALDYLATEQCSFYQVDLYANDATTAALIAGGFLTSPGHPTSPGRAAATTKGRYSKQWSTDCPELVEVTPALSFTPPSCQAAGTVTKTEVGVDWALSMVEPGGDTTYTASPKEGYFFPDGVQTEWVVPNLDQLPADSYECYQPIEVTPTLTWTPPTCDEDGTVTLGDDDGYHWESVPNEDGSTTYTAVPDEGYIFPEVAQTEWIVPDLDQLDVNDPECVVDYPVPALFNAPTPAPTCATAASS